MLLKRPYTNTPEERNAKYDIQELLSFERFCRDNGQWDEMRNCFTEDSVVDISWFKGSGDDFVTASKNMNTYAPHKIYNTLTYVNGDRAVSIMMATIQIRLQVQGVLCEVNSDTKLLFKTQKIEGHWYIAGFTSIYDKDSMAPVIPNNEVTFPASALNGLRESYACLAYTGISAGRSVNQELPGRDRPDSVEEIYTELENWFTKKSEKGKVCRHRHKQEKIEKIKGNRGAHAGGLCPCAGRAEAAGDGFDGRLVHGSMGRER